MNEKIITVIMPMYNAESTVIIALDSVRMQTGLKAIKEVIVIDDGSTDNSVAYVRSFMNDNPELPIRLLEQENSGAAVARNKGIEKVDTKYVAFLDADDIWFPEKIERQLAVIREFPHIRFLGTAWDERGLRIGFKKISSLYNGSVKDVCIKSFPVTPSVLMETTLFEEVGLFVSDNKLAEDINLFQRVAAKGNYYFLPEQLVAIDVGKGFFAEKGLSSHLKKMHEGTIRNIRELRKSGDITWSFWLLMRCFYQLKYIRRILKRQIYIMRSEKGKK